MSVRAEGEPSRDEDVDVAAVAALRLTLVSNALQPPPDEGTKKVANEMAKRLSRLGALVWRIDASSSVGARKLLFDRRQLARLRRYAPAVAVYVPTQSATFGSLLRGTVLRYATGAKIVIIALQVRELGSVANRLVRRLAPDLLLTPSPAVLAHARRAGLTAEILELGVETARFLPVDEARRRELRTKYELPLDAPIVLHVGHASRLRGTEWLARLDPELTRVVVVGRSLGVDDDLVHVLRAAGVHVIDTYLPAVEEIYQAADVYAFSVVDDAAAIGAPLSVLEAMACNLPVVTTRFGALPRMFGDGGGGLIFVDGEHEFGMAISAAVAARGGACSTRELVLPFDWSATAAAIVRRATELCNAS